MIKKINNNLVKIVNMLSDGAYHDGTTIGKKLRATRSAVWKTMKKLESYAIKIDSVKGKGYALNEPLILLDTNKIKKKLHHKTAELSIFESVTSTNTYLKTIKPAANVHICLSEQQTAGKGRLSRYWYSPFARNIYLSCLYRFQKDLSELAGLSLVTGLAIIKTLKSHGVEQKLFVKWPNDIIFEDKKLAGNLIEIQAESNGHSQAIIGIGLNVNMLDDAKQITQPWISMQKFLGEYVDRNELCARLINTLMDYLEQFNAHGLKIFMEEWGRMDFLTNQVVTVKNINEKLRGIVTGINEQGHLKLQFPDGTIRSFSSGDTSIEPRSWNKDQQTI